MGKFIAKIVDLIFNTFTVLVRVVVFLFQKTVSHLGRIFNYIYESCDTFIADTIKHIRQSKNPFVRKFFSASTIYLAISLLLIITFFHVFLETFYIVSVGSNAIVTRMGKFVRETEPGLNFKIPFIEKVFIVNTGNLLQETIGFKMVEKVNYQVKTPAELAAESFIQRQEAMTGTGRFANELNRDPNFTQSYLVDQMRRNRNRATREEVLQKRAIPGKIMHDQAQGFSQNGRAIIPQEAEILSGNLNIVVVTCAIQYYIEDARKYLFGSTNVRENIRNVSFAALRLAIGDSIDYEVLSTKRNAIEGAALEHASKMLSQLDVGIKIASMFIIKALPPEQVKDAYDEVSIAHQEMETKILEARIKFNKVIPKALGKAKKIIHAANAYSLEVRNKAEGEAERYRLILEEYKKEKEATWDRLYIESMQAIFEKGNVTLLDPDIKGILPVFPKEKGKDQLAHHRIENIAEEHAIKEEAIVAAHESTKQAVHQAVRHMAESRMEPVPPPVPTPAERIPAVEHRGQTTPAAGQARSVSARPGPGANPNHGPNHNPSPNPNHNPLTIH